MPHWIRPQPWPVRLHPRTTLIIQFNRLLHPPNQLKASFIKPRDKLESTRWLYTALQIMRNMQFSKRYSTSFRIHYWSKILRRAARSLAALLTQAGPRFLTQDLRLVRISAVDSPQLCLLRLLNLITTKMGSSIIRQVFLSQLLTLRATQPLPLRITLLTVKICPKPKANAAVRSLSNKTQQVFFRKLPWQNSQVSSLLLTNRMLIIFVTPFHSIKFAICNEKITAESSMTRKISRLSLKSA